MLSIPGSKCTPFPVIAPEKAIALLRGRAQEAVSELPQLIRMANRFGVMSGATLLLAAIMDALHQDAITPLTLDRWLVLDDQFSQMRGEIYTALDTRVNALTRLSAPAENSGNVIR